MKKRTGFLLVLLVALTVFVAWKATEPNPFYAGRDMDSFVHPYPWFYLGWMIAFSSLIFGISFLKRPLIRFVGALVAFLLGAFLTTILIFTVMHAPPVHDEMLLVVFFISSALLFYSGYTCALWRSKRHDRDRAS